jgi:CDP-6-deoxy-D-xylo-4-hexulose-3-dehydrase
MQDTITSKDRMKLAKFVLTTKQFTNGPKVKKFEKEWSNWLGAKYSLFVSSGSTANSLLIAAVKEKYGLKDGDKVLLPACTWVTNVGPIIQMGFKPIFCDINIDNFSFDEEQLKYIAETHKDIKMIFVTHLLGFSANNELCQELFPGAIILDDVCESHGCTDPNGIKRGANSTGATFSFYFGHHMTTVEGGMVSTNDKELYDLMRMKRSHGMARESINYDSYAQQYSDISKLFLFVTDGYNFRNHEMCAIIGSSQLKRLDKMIEIRRENYKMFREVVNRYPDKVYPVAENSTNSSFCFPIIAKNKDIYKKLIDKFEEHEIEHRPIVSGNLLKQPFLKDYELTTNKKNTSVDQIHNLGVYLGNNHFVGKKQIKLLKKILEDINE